MHFEGWSGEAGPGFQRETGVLPHKDAGSCKHSCNLGLVRYLNIGIKSCLLAFF